MKHEEVKKLRIGQIIGVMQGNSIIKGEICMINHHNMRIGVYDDTRNYFEFPYRLVKILNEAIGSKEVFIDFMKWMRKYDFIDQVNIDELIVDDYLKSIKQRSAINS